MTGDAAPTPRTMPLRIAVLASGQGTNLQALLDAVHGREAQVVAVAGDRADAPALGRAAAAGIETAAFPRAAHETREERDAAIAAWLVARDVELVVLAGYMAILTPAFLRAFPDRVLNVHPSLLPAFPGIRAIEQAVDHGVRIFGVTVHLVDEGVDTGPIVLQDAVVLPGSPDAAQVHAALQPIEHRLLPEAVRLVARGALRRDPDEPRRVRIDG
ncbi:phosphoribosylglycinamide formyltransferase [Patulibacter brassicae]|uniref:Phosphoribosylglycinamide formyltransferase n=1 Tax=Patulibacter brassicae TaxID=1705717 RepID=A0ABU4VJG3_9ACTN|nr:phosphoribosylglycinamide formyltransferase [Patulibacter brassicae]MDX8151829.1 phosphoribosylglycinamide formyltransferase [Patulibacter brassicae]